jgi:hypothetical protein
LKMLLIARDLWEVIDPAERPEEDKKTAVATWDKKDKIVLASIALAMKASEQEHIHNCTTAEEAWDHLKEVYQGKGMHRLLSLMKNLAGAKLEKKTMKEYIRGVMQTADEIAEIGHQLDNPVIMAFILNGLPDTYRYLVVNLESQLEYISIQDLSARLTDEEVRIGLIAVEARSIEESQEKGYEQGLLARTGKRVGNGRSDPCEYCGREGHPSEKCYNKSNAKFCPYCGRSGHDEDGCFTKSFRENKGGRFVANIAESSHGGPVGIVRPS